MPGKDGKTNSQRDYAIGKEYWEIKFGDFSWMGRASTLNKNVKKSNSRLVWTGGTWINGNWRHGTFKNGSWQNGKFRGGLFKNGTWRKGTFYGGTFKNSTWQNGRWKQGTWVNSVWQKGKIWSIHFKGWFKSIMNPDEFKKLEKEVHKIYPSWGSVSYGYGVRTIYYVARNFSYNPGPITYFRYYGNIMSQNYGKIRKSMR